MDPSASVCGGGGVLVLWRSLDLLVSVGVGGVVALSFSGVLHRLVGDEVVFVLGVKNANLRSCVEAGAQGLALMTDASTYQVNPSQILISALQLHRR